MMQDPIDDKMFEDLLGDYAAPVDDNGFSAKVMDSLPPVSDTDALRTRLISSAGLVGVIIAAFQIPALTKLIAKVKLPEVNTPSMGSLPTLSEIEPGLMSTPYGMAITLLLGLMLAWVCASFIFGDQM